MKVFGALNLRFLQVEWGLSIGPKGFGCKCGAWGVRVLDEFGGLECVI